MHNFRQAIYEPITFIAPAAGVVSGVPVLIGDICVVPQVTAASGVSFAGLTEGVFIVDKQTGFTASAGDAALFDFVTNSRVESSGTQIGAYVVDAASGDTTAKVAIFNSLFAAATISRLDALDAIALNGGTLDLRVDALEVEGVVFAAGITAEDTSTGVTAGTNETAFTNYVAIPANTLAVGDRVRLSAKVKCLDNNAGDTVALAAKLAAAAGLVASTFDWATVAAVDAADGDTWQMEAELRVVAIGAAVTAKFTGSGKSWKNGATPAYLGTDVDDDTSVATNAIIHAGLTYTWSASHADNQVRIKELFVAVIRPSV